VSQNPVIIRAAGLGKVHHSPDGRAVRALEGLDLSVREGELAVLLGPSGCGKSTLLQLVAGFEQPSAGSLDLGGRPIAGPGPDRGYIFQEFALFPWLTVLDNVAFGLRSQGQGKAQARASAREHLVRVGLSAFATAYPHTLSGGMKQRVAIARALAYQPTVLLMDEPFGALDAQTRRELQRELVRVWSQDRKTVLFVTHSVDEALLLADTVHLMSARPGHIVRSVVLQQDRPRDEDAAWFRSLRRELNEVIEHQAGRLDDAG
jgi:NitT/TauT family transport system ATP-binding protein